MPGENVDLTIDLNGFIIALCEAPYRWIQQAVDEIEEEKLYFRPSEDSNHIAWLIWHLSRWRDRISAGMMAEEQVWTSGGWDRAFGIAPERTGLGDTLEEVSAFRPDRSQLAGYAAAAHEALVDRVARATQQQLEAEIEYSPGNSRPAWRALVSVVEDTAEHTGQVNYLRGLTAGYGWR